MENNPLVFPYIPNSVPRIKAEMMREVGVTDEMELFEEIPEALRLTEKMNLPEPIRDEYSIKRHMENILNKNRNCNQYLNFFFRFQHPFFLCGVPVCEFFISLYFRASVNKVVATINR